MDWNIESGDSFTAIWRGERYRFVLAEHANIGDGWMCHEIDVKLPKRTYYTWEMSEFRPDAAPTPAAS